MVVHRPRRCPIREHFDNRLTGFVYLDATTIRCRCCHHLDVLVRGMCIPVPDGVMHELR